jgi:hypothetical protein
MVGRFSQALMDEAKTRGWVVISMKNDRKRIFVLYFSAPYVLSLGLKTRSQLT